MLNINNIPIDFIKKYVLRGGQKLAETGLMRYML